MERYYEQSNANVHRGTYLIAEEATAALEGARAKVARFIGAPHAREVVFTKNATEALNLVAKAWGRANLSAGDAVVLTELEHHANIVPWHQLHDELGHRAALDPGRGPTATSTSPTSTAWSTAPRSSPSPPCRTCSARCSRSSGWWRAAHDAGAIAVDRRLAVRPPPRHRRAGLGRRLRRLHRPQDVRPHRHRRALGHHRDPRRHPAVPHRRRDDPQRHQGGVHAQRAALEVRGRHPADRRGGGARRRRRLPRGARHGGRARARGVAHRLRPALAHGALRRRAHDPRPVRAGRARRRAVASPTATCTPTTSPRCSTSTACACGPATTAPSP